MSKYLDFTGLSYFWTKLKNKIQKEVLNINSKVVKMGTLVATQLDTNVAINGTTYPYVRICTSAFTALTTQGLKVYAPSNASKIIFLNDTGIIDVINSNKYVGEGPVDEMYFYIGFVVPNNSVQPEFEFIITKDVDDLIDRNGNEIELTEDINNGYDSTLPIIGWVKNWIYSPGKGLTFNTSTNKVEIAHRATEPNSNTIASNIQISIESNNIPSVKVPKADKDTYGLVKVKESLLDNGVIDAVSKQELDKLDFYSKLETSSIITNGVTINSNKYARASVSIDYHVLKYLTFTVRWDTSNSYIVGAAIYSGTEDFVHGTPTLRAYSLGTGEVSYTASEDSIFKFVLITANNSTLTAEVYIYSKVINSVNRALMNITLDEVKDGTKRNFDILSLAVTQHELDILRVRDSIVLPDWEQNDDTALDYIKNKPTIEDVKVVNSNATLTAGSSVTLGTVGSTPITANVPKVNSAAIVDGAVLTCKIAGNAVTSEKLANGSVTTLKLDKKTSGLLASSIGGDNTTTFETEKTIPLNNTNTKVYLSSASLPSSIFAGKLLHVESKSGTVGFCYDNGSTYIVLASGALSCDYFPQGVSANIRIFCTVKTNGAYSISTRLYDGEVTSSKLSSNIVLKEGNATSVIGSKVVTTTLPENSELPYIAPSWKAITDYVSKSDLSLTNSPKYFFGKSAIPSTTLKIGTKCAYNSVVIPHVTTAIGTINTCGGIYVGDVKITSHCKVSGSELGMVAPTWGGMILYAQPKGNYVETDGNGLVPSSKLPSYVDDVLEYDGKSNFPTSGESGKIYVDISTNLAYRWGGSQYTEISPSLALGTTSSTAFRGDYGNTAYSHATDASRMTVAKATGLYKIATTAQGHVASATAVTKSDITALGIPAQDTVYTLPVATTNALGGIKLGQQTAVKDVAYDNYVLLKDSNNVGYVSIPQIILTNAAKHTGTADSTQGKTLTVYGSSKKLFDVSVLTTDMVSGIPPTSDADKLIPTWAGVTSMGYATTSLLPGDASTSKKGLVQLSGDIATDKNNNTKAATPAAVSAALTSLTSSLKNTFPTGVSYANGILYVDKDETETKVATAADIVKDGGGITSHQDISGKADKSATVSTVAYDTTNKKLTKTINGSTSEVVTAATIVTDGGGVKDVSGKADKTDFAVADGNAHTTDNDKTQGVEITIYNKNAAKAVSADVVQSSTISGSETIDTDSAKKHIPTWQGMMKYVTGKGYLTSHQSLANYLPLSGGSLTGALRLGEGGLLSKYISGYSASNIVVIPNVPYGNIDPTHTSSVYAKELLKWICANYPSRTETIFIGRANPNGEGFVIIHIYDTSAVNSDGYPQYSSGFMRMLDSDGTNTAVFGTHSYNYHYENVLNSNTKYAASGSVGGSALLVDGENASGNAFRNIWFSDSVTETKRNRDVSFQYNPSAQSVKLGTATYSYNGILFTATTTPIKWKVLDPNVGAHYSEALRWKVDGTTGEWSPQLGYLNYFGSTNSGGRIVLTPTVPDSGAIWNHNYGLQLDDQKITYYGKEILRANQFAVTQAGAKTKGNETAVGDTLTLYTNAGNKTVNVVTSEHVSTTRTGQSDDIGLIPTWSGVDKRFATKDEVADCLVGPVGSSDIADNAVTYAKIANNAVNTRNIVGGSITAAKLASDLITLKAGVATTVSQGMHVSISVTTTPLKAASNATAANQTVGGNDPAVAPVEVCTLTGSYATITVPANATITVNRYVVSNSEKDDLSSYAKLIITNSEYWPGTSVFQVLVVGNTGQGTVTYTNSTNDSVVVRVGYIRYVPYSGGSTELSSNNNSQGAVDYTVKQYSTAQKLDLQQAFDYLLDLINSK